METYINGGKPWMAISLLYNFMCYDGLNVGFIY